MCKLLACNAEKTVKVATEYGEFFGTEETLYGKKVNRFLGIPYALPPIGERRFTKSEPIMFHIGNYLADTMPPPCKQVVQKYSILQSNISDSEDCLYLNIWAPKKHKNLAVMVWLYGGFNKIGSIDLPMYNGLVLSAVGNVIFVSLNYRMGFFGFFHDENQGNLGLQHQQFLKNISTCNLSIYKFLQIMLIDIDIFCSTL